MQLYVFRIIFTLQTVWGSTIMGLNHIRQTVSCAIMGNYSVVTGGVADGKGKVEFVLTDKGKPKQTVDGELFSFLNGTIIYLFEQI